MALQDVIGSRTQVTLEMYVEVIEHITLRKHHLYASLLAAFQELDKVGTGTIYACVLAT